MSKFLKIPNGDYKVSVQPGGTITLDTGEASGQVVITGDLVVEGDTTTVNTANLLVEDNIILLNKGETSAGISLDTAGIQIDRGTFPDAYLLFDENISYTVPIDIPDIGGSSINGAFVLKDNDGNLRALRTNVINTSGGNLNLIGSSTGIVNVSGTVNYEARVLDDDDIPNKKYVDDALSTLGDNVSVTGLADFDTEISIRDSSRAEINDSRIRFTIDSVDVAQFDNNRAILQGIVITDTTIEVKNPSPLQAIDYTATDMIIKHPDSSSAVVIDTTLGLKPILSELVFPDVPTEGARIYSSTESIGGTGIYFVNEEGTRDEMVSRSRAILYGIIF